MSESFLPLILVSAVDIENATKLISEMIDNEVIDSDKNLRKGRVWRLVNKYYRVDVEVCASAAGAAPPPGRCEAHVAYAGAADAAPAAADAPVRLVLADGARVPGALAAWARRRGYEPVALAERDAQAGACGLARVREALHAHRWPGLRRLDRQDGADGADEADEAAVERAEAFAEALGALAAAGPGAALGDAERRRRAERLVGAFCRALGDELPLGEQ